MYNEQQIEQICNYYCGENMRRLRKICHNKIKKFTYLSNMDYDDFMSKANETVFLAAKSFDENKNDSFEGFLVSCLQRKFYSLLHSKTQIKRRIPQHIIVYLDAPIGADSNSTLSLGDIISSRSDTFDEAFEVEYRYEKVKLYINSLSKKQGDIAKLLLCGYSPNEIMEILSLSKNEFKCNMAELKRYENICLLF